MPAGHTLQVREPWTPEAKEVNLFALSLWVAVLLMRTDVAPVVLHHVLHHTPYCILSLHRWERFCHTVREHAGQEQRMKKVRVRGGQSMRMVACSSNVRALGGATFGAHV